MEDKLLGKLTSISSNKKEIKVEKNSGWEDDAINGDLDFNDLEI